jgi:site-specific DNA-methyltransferase (adenine-specific)
VALYRWLLQKYAMPGDTIFDSHVGSGSSRIACYDMGYSFTGCEIDPDYHAGQEARYKAHAAQGRLFEPDEFVMAQGGLFDHIHDARKMVEEKQ